MQEVKVDKKQFDKINELRYNLKQKYDYISTKVIPNKYTISEDTVFFTYQNFNHDYYLCFDAEEIPNGKIKPSSWVPRKE